MKKKLMDTEADVVFGGSTTACTAEQDEKVNNSVCPFCGGKLVERFTQDMNRKRMCRGSCKRVYLYSSASHWTVIYNPSESSGC